MNLRKLIPTTLVLLLAGATAWATFNYEYGADEYVTVSAGLSPDGRLAVTTHGEDEDGYQNFHVYLFDAVTGMRIGPLEEITETLDTGAGAFGARWKADSTEATIVYRIDRHAPLKSMTYHFAKGRAVPVSRRPVDVRDEALIRFWQEHCSAPGPAERTFGTPKAKP